MTAHASLPRQPYLVKASVHQIGANVDCWRPSNHATLHKLPLRGACTRLLRRLLPLLFLMLLLLLLLLNLLQGQRRLCKPEVALLRRRQRRHLAAVHRCCKAPPWR